MAGGVAASATTLSKGVDEAVIAFVHELKRVLDGHSAAHARFVENHFSTTAKEEFEQESGSLLLLGRRAAVSAGNAFAKLLVTRKEDLLAAAERTHREQLRWEREQAERKIEEVRRAAALRLRGVEGELSRLQRDNVSKI